MVSTDGPLSSGRRRRSTAEGGSETRRYDEISAVEPNCGLTEELGVSGLVPGQNHHPAAVALALAFGAHTGVVGQRHVYNPAFGR